MLDTVLDKDLRNLPAAAFVSESVTHKGPRHTRNEDAFFSRPEIGLHAVADGMGGHRDGDVASATIIEEIAGLRTRMTHAFGHRVAAVDAAIHRANERLYSRYLANPEDGISGSTVLALILQHDLATCIWAGDSRLYLQREGHLFLLSEDHADEVGRLTSAIGAEEDPALERRTIEVRAGDIFVLCTDGLIKGLSENDMADVLAEWHEGIAQDLLSKAITGGSRDDITCVIVQVPAHG